MSESGMALTDHLGELRKRLMIAAISWLVAFLGCYGFGERLFEEIAKPVRQATARKIPFALPLLMAVPGV